VDALKLITTGNGSTELVYSNCFRYYGRKFGEKGNIFKEIYLQQYVNKSKCMFAPQPMVIFPIYPIQ
jgi:hypothetical protein